jgi:hypothetical protein
MTGIFLRALNKDGKWDAVEIEQLSDSQLGECMAGKSTEELIRWMQSLCDTIRTAEQMLLDHGIIEGHYH